MEYTTNFEHLHTSRITHEKRALIFTIMREPRQRTTPNLCTFSTRGFIHSSNLCTFIRNIVRQWWNVSINYTVVIINPAERMVVSLHEYIRDFTISYVRGALIKQMQLVDVESKTENTEGKQTVLWRGASDGVFYSLAKCKELGCTNYETNECRHLKHQFRLFWAFSELATALNEFLQFCWTVVN